MLCYSEESGENAGWKNRTEDQTSGVSREVRDGGRGEREGEREGVIKGGRGIEGGREGGS